MKSFFFFNRNIFDKVDFVAPFLCVSLFLDVKGGPNNICRKVSLEKSHDFYLQRKEGLDHFLHLTNVDAKGQESLASAHMEGKGCVWHFQHFELDTIVLPLQNNRSLCLHPKRYL